MFQDGIAVCSQWKEGGRKGHWRLLAARIRRELQLKSKYHDKDAGRRDLPTEERAGASFECFWGRGGEAAVLSGALVLGRIMS